MPKFEPPMTAVKRARTVSQRRTRAGSKTCSHEAPGFPSLVEGFTIPKYPTTLEERGECEALVRASMSIKDDEKRREWLDEWARPGRKSREPERCQAIQWPAVHCSVPVAVPVIPMPPAKWMLNPSAQTQVMKVVLGKL